MGGMPPRRCLLGKRCLPNTPLHHVYKWVSHIAMELVDHLDSSCVSFTFSITVFIRWAMHVLNLCHPMARPLGVHCRSCNRRRFGPPPDYPNARLYSSCQRSFHCWRAICHRRASSQTLCHAPGNSPLSGARWSSLWTHNKGNGLALPRIHTHATDGLYYMGEI